MLKVKIENFRGIENEIVVLEHISVFLGKNGHGKTSIMSAITFALTGNAKKTDIREGANEASVSMEFPDNTVFKRVITPSATRVSQSCYLNGKKCQTKVANEFISKRFGCSVSALSSLMTEDILNDNMGKMLFDILPMNCSRNFFFEFLKEFKGFDLTDKEQDIIIKYLDENNIDIITFSDIDAMYKEMYERRRVKNALAKNAKSRSLFDMNKIVNLAPEKILREERDKLLKQDGAVKEILKRQKEYEKIVALRNKMELDKKEIKKKLDALKKVSAPDSGKEKQIKADKEKFNQVILKRQQIKSALENNNAMFQKVLANIKSSVCPIHSMIKCTTDKSAFQADIERQIEENSKNILEINSFILKCQEQIRKRDDMLEAYHKEVLQYQEKVMLERQFAFIVLPEIPEKPVLPEKQDYSDELKLLEQQIAVWVEYNLAQKAKEELVLLEEEIAIYELLVAAFSPKGVKAIIIQKAIQPLKDECNNLAKNINTNLELEFEVGKSGLEVLAKFHEKFVPVEVLSSGEKVVVLYLIMELIHNITNAKIMAIDNLDRLDRDNMRNLFSLLEKSNSFEYLLFGSVDHKDTVETIAGYKVWSVVI